MRGFFYLPLIFRYSIKCENKKEILLRQLNMLKVHIKGSDLNSNTFFNFTFVMINLSTNLLFVPICASSYRKFQSKLNAYHKQRGKSSCNFSATCIENNLNKLRREKIGLLSAELMWPEKRFAEKTRQYHKGIINVDE